MDPVVADRLLRHGARQAMIDGASTLLAPTWGSLAAGAFDDQHRGSNMLDGGAHMYGCYETKDGKYISIGSLEPQFYQLLLELTGTTDVPELAPSNQVSAQRLSIY